MWKELEDLVKESKKLRGKNESLQKQIETLEKQLKSQTGGSASDEGTKLLLSKYFSPSQISILMGTETKPKWKSEELSRAFLLKYLGHDAYSYLKNQRNFPLPEISDLNSWVSGFNFRNGVLNDALKIMNIIGEQKRPGDKFTVLSFVEVEVESKYEFDEVGDCILGPYKTMSVIMAQGLLDDWKQPIYYQFDKKVTEKIILNLIKKLFEINYEVVALIAEYDDGNRDLMKDLNIHVDKTYFNHPITKGKVYFFADSCFLLKQLRNWFLDTGFLLGDTVIYKDPVESLILQPSLSGAEPSHKLTERHLIEKNGEKSGKLARQLFSETTAKALKTHFGENAPEEGFCDFFLLVSNWSNIMNSHSSKTDNPAKKPFGLLEGLQSSIVENMISTMKKMTCIGRESLQLFQQGIIISSESLLGLHAWLGVLPKCHAHSNEPAILLTRRLTLECLETFLSQLKSKSKPHDFLTPMKVIYRIQKILFGKMPDKGSDQYLVPIALKRAAIEVTMKRSSFEDPVAIINRTPHHKPK